MFKKNIFTGLIVLIPLVLTFWVIYSLAHFLDQVVLFLPYQYQPNQLVGFNIPGVGVILTIVSIFLVGLIANNFFGKRFISLYEIILDKLPFVKSIYGGIKQVSDTLFSNNSNAFSKAVLIEFPDAKNYTFAFITGETDERISKILKGKYVNVYVPTTPNPTSGYTLMVPRNKIKEIDVSVDQALKYVISMGVVPPKSNTRSNKAKR
ncbi:DUF502 domain-containing protein [Methylophilaceae bacterium]|jgi:uncharacterized membrane protein|nr:DUF502 domain-containing protein [Methylophilaceae bacterium]